VTVPTDSGTDAATTVNDGSSTQDAGHPLSGVVALVGSGETPSLSNTAFCAVLSDGSARCWGSNSSGQLGLGTSGAPAAYPVQPTGLSARVTAIAVGDDHGCAIQTTDAGAVTLCWGDDTRGGVGLGGDGGLHVPTAIGAVSGASAVASGGGVSCALVSTEMYCWGDNDYGNSCIDSTGVQSTPYFVGLSVDKIVVGYTGLALASGTVYSWGRNDYGQLARVSGETCMVGDAGFNCDQYYGTSAIAADASVVAVGGEHSCAVVSGQAVCFGDDRSGQLGDGKTTTNPVQTPVAVVGLSAAPVQLALGSQFTCALVAGGAVQCWGSGSYGVAGVADAGPGGLALSPVTVLTTGATAIAAGDATACALMSDTTVKCWGRNAEGELGIGAIDSLAHPTPSAVLTP
jgi:alpha-tubulin suppressor-like RCC1 family protein